MFRLPLHIDMDCDRTHHQTQPLHQDSQQSNGSQLIQLAQSITYLNMLQTIFIFFVVIFILVAHRLRTVELIDIVLAIQYKESNILLRICI